jgi:hypothetical protein
MRCRRFFDGDPGLNSLLGNLPKVSLPGIVLVEYRFVVSRDQHFDGIPGIRRLNW